MGKLLMQTNDLFGFMPNVVFELSKISILLSVELQGKINNHVIIDTWQAGDLP
jgi:hypothetical protein